MGAVFELMASMDNEASWYTPLTLTAMEENSTVSLTMVFRDEEAEALDISRLYYKHNDGLWQLYTLDTVITLANAGDQVKFHNLTESFNNRVGWLAASAYVHFVLTGTVAASGNIQSLLNYSAECGEFCFDALFENCPSLVQAPELPSVKLSQGCYVGMFSGCTSLKKAPELPATELKKLCYAGLFSGCSALQEVPALPAPELVGKYCMLAMFKDCAQLDRIEVNFSKWLDHVDILGEDGDTATLNWVSGVAAAGTFIKPEGLSRQFGIHRIPKDWTNINKEQE